MTTKKRKSRGGGEVGAKRKSEESEKQESPPAGGQDRPKAVKTVNSLPRFIGVVSKTARRAIES